MMSSSEHIYEIVNNRHILKTIPYFWITNYASELIFLFSDVSDERLLKLLAEIVKK